MVSRPAGLLSAFTLALAASTAMASDFTLPQILSYPYPQELVAASKGSALAWVQDELGVRNVWMADGASATPRQLTHYTADDGQEITQLQFSPDGGYLLFVRGGDHDANWPMSQEPDPDASTQKPEVRIWSVDLKSGNLNLVGEGDAPAIAPDGARVAFIQNHQVSWAPLDGSAKPQSLFYDRGRVAELSWSPDGKALAFVSNRDDHSFVGVYRDDKTPVHYLSPSTTHDFMPRWSPDGTRIAFVRVPGDGGVPQPILKQVPNPWSLWVADAATGKGSLVWQSPKTLHGSYPDTQGEANLHWLAGDRLLFLANLDNWPHLYSVAARGGAIRLLTPGDFMVEDVSVSADGSHVVYSANVGANTGDAERRHLYVLTSDGSVPEKILSGGENSEWRPQLAGDGKTLGFIQGHVQMPPLVMAGTVDKADWRPLDQDRVPAEFPTSGFVVPKPVTFQAADGLTVHGVLFAAEGSAHKPTIIFVHGGPPRQMLLGWHYMDYYSNAYAVNQYLATHGYVVLALNYRLGIGYGYDYKNPAHWGFTGASEYQDVLAAAKFLQRDPRVDGKRIGIWGGSYGGYLTAMALARNSNIFKAGVDLHGVHDWSYDVSDIFAGGKPRYEEGDRKQAMKVAFQSSPVASMKTWKSPVLLIQGDDDRNVYFHEMIDLANRLQDQGVHYEELVLPNEIHGFLRHASWLAADQATVEFLDRQFGVKH